MNVLLTSTGLRESHVHQTFLSMLTRPPVEQSAAVITTASVEWKERNKNAVATKQRLAADGFGRVAFLDVEDEDPAALRGFDVVFINGGNPFHLLHHLRKSGADRILRELVEADTRVVAASAGAMVLGPDLSLAAWFTPEMNTLCLTDLGALGLVRPMVYPHFGRREADEEEIRRFERASGNLVTRLADSQALWVRDGDPVVLSP